jgi:uracil-DNA glycosylase family 4
MTAEYPEHAVAASREDSFSIDCRDCSRLAGFLDLIRAKHPTYYSQPVPSFGDPNARVLIVGLAPGLHGANASGRAFTGDFAGILLYRTLYEFGLSSAPESTAADDGLELRDCRITNAVRCLPPANKPSTAEVDTCNRYLQMELDALPSPALVIALGGIAHRAVLKARQLRLVRFQFGHARRHDLGSGLTLLDSYHCSRYNTQTRRLTEAMFQDVFQQARHFLDHGLSDERDSGEYD